MHTEDSITSRHGLVRGLIFVVRPRIQLKTETGLFYLSTLFLKPMHRTVSTGSYVHAGHQYKRCTDAVTIGRYNLVLCVRCIGLLITWWWAISLGRVLYYPPGDFKLPGTHLNSSSGACTNGQRLDSNHAGCKRRSFYLFQALLILLRPQVHTTLPVWRVIRAGDVMR